MHLCVNYFVTVNRANYHGNVWRRSDFRFTFAHVERPKSTRQVVFSLFSKTDNKSCHSQEEKTYKYYSEWRCWGIKSASLHRDKWQWLFVHGHLMKNEQHILCAITRDVLCTFLACARLAINVSCYERFLSFVITFANSLDPDQAGLTKSRAWSGFELFDIHSYMVSEQKVGAGS